MRVKVLDSIRFGKSPTYKYVGEGQVISEEQMEEIIQRAKETVRPQIERERRNEFLKPRNVCCHG